MGNGRIALVTGGNRGIGLEIVRQLAAAGFDVVLAARDAGRGAAAVAALGTQAVTTVALDVTKAESVRAAVAEVVQRHGRIDVLVNNAGVMLDRSRAPVTSTFAVAPELLADTMATNVIGPLRLIQAVMPHMRKAGYGRIVNLSSRMGQLSDMGAGGAPAYRISKTALNALTVVAAAELGAGNIKINAMHPGWVQTDMGGPTAPLTAPQAATTAVWLATLPDDGPSGGFFFEMQPMAW